MEHIIVKIIGEEEERVPVLVNNEENGFTNEVIQLEEGYVELSVKIPGAETIEIELIDTTAEEPMEVFINVV